jgi:DNA-binding Lrp family transcriptional regulator
VWSQFNAAAVAALKATGLRVCGWQFVYGREPLNEAIAALRNIPEVLECHAPAGDTDLLIRVVAKSPDDLYRVSEEIRLCPGIVRTSTSMFLREVIPYRTTGLLGA